MKYFEIQIIISSFINGLKYFHNDDLNWNEYCIYDNTFKDHKLPK